MNLKEYVDRKGRGASSELCSELGISLQFFSHLVTEKRSVSPARAMQIESKTERQVMRWDLRPNDWWLIWPELQKHKDAPPVPESAHE